MNEHKAPGNVQATAPATLPMRNNVLGTTVTAPVKNNVLGTTETAPVKNNVLGTTETAPVKNNVLGATETASMRNNVLGATMTAPAKNNVLGTSTKPMAPVLSEMMPDRKYRGQPEHYQPGGLQADYYQTAQQAGYYPPAMPQTGMYPPAAPQTGMSHATPQMGMYPSAMPQTGMPQTGMYPPAAPQRSIFQPAAQPGQGLMQQMPPRTSIMTSGVGVRESVLSSTDFTQGFLQTQIGRYVKVEFVLGTNMLIDREGTLVKVGTDYILIQETETDDYLLCDIYSIRFIRFYY